MVAVLAEDLTALVTEAGGVAACIKKGAPARLPVQVNQTRLAAGDVILTGPKSHVKLLIEGKPGPTTGQEPPQTTVEIKAQSRVEMTELFTDLAKGTENVKVSISQGQLISNVRKIDPNSERFEVSTPTAVAAVRGTNFSTKVIPLRGSVKPKVSFRVYHGNIDILDPINRTRRRQLDKGDTLDIEPSGAFIQGSFGGSERSGAAPSIENLIPDQPENDERDDDTGTFPERQEGEEDDTGGRDTPGE
jgi:hypothetical protein